MHSCAHTHTHTHTHKHIRKHARVNAHLYTHKRDLERVPWLEAFPFSKCITLHFIYFQFKIFSQLYWGMIDKSHIYLRCTMWCFDICIHCKMITAIKLINISIPHVITLDFVYVCVCVCVWWEHLRCTLLANFMDPILFKFEEYFHWVCSQLRASFLKLFQFIN